MKVGYTFLNNNNPEFFNKASQNIPASGNVKVSLRQQVKSTNFKLAEKKKLIKNVTSDDSASAGSSASSPEGDNSTTASQDGASSQDGNEAANARTSDYKNEDDLL